MRILQRLLFLASILVWGVTLLAAQDRGGGRQRNDDTPNEGVTQERGSQPSRKARPATAPQPKAVRPARSNGRAMKQPAQRSAPAKQQRNAPVLRSIQSPRGQAAQQPNRAPAVRSQSAKAVDRPSNTRPYDRQRLTNLGVKSIPQPITSNTAILRTDRSHSVIRYPQSGPQGGHIQGSLVPPRQFNNGTVRTQMSVVIQPSFSLRLDQERRGENQRNRSYWHTDNGFYYNHYIDDWGYHWYGWYRGDRYFWTRHYNGRWWWYDPDYERWCYYHDNNWYWQDPYQQDAIYVYDNDSYISLDFNLHN